MPPVRTPTALLAGVLATNPSGPLITFYDDATGERIELSAITLDNWVAKTANLLQDGGIEPGARAAVLLPPHWQTAAILLGSWSAGLAVTLTAEPADVAFAGPDQLDAALGTGADEVYGLSLAPMAMPLRAVPAGVTDYATEVRTHGDRFFPYQQVDPDAPALGALSYAEVVAAGAARATELGLTSTDRLLVAGPRDGEVDWLLAPLAAGASLVLCRTPDEGKLADRAAAERVTAALGVTIPGVRRAG